jgi:hypothetical protein
VKVVKGGHDADSIAKNKYRPSPRVSTLWATVSLYSVTGRRLMRTVCAVNEGSSGRLCLKCDGTRAGTRFRLSAKRTSPFKSAGASVQSNTDSRGVRISGSNAGYTMFRSSMKGTDYPLHSPVSSSLPLPCVKVCHHISIGIYCVTVCPHPTANFWRLKLQPGCFGSIPFPK